MSDTYTLIIPSHDLIAMNAFGEALQKIAFDNGYASRIPKSPTEKTIAEMFSGEVQLGDLSLPEAPLALTGDERYPTDQFVYMYDAVNDAYSLGRSDNEVVDYESQGFVRHTAEQQAAWRDAGTSAELDVNGLPWDARIHAASKARNADDSWRIRRTPKDKTPEQWIEYYDEVIAELKQLMEIPVGEKTIDDAPVETVLVPLPPVDQTHVMTVCHGESIPVPPPAADVFIPAPPVVVPPPVVTNNDVTTFPQLMTWLTARHGKITVEQINGVVSSHGLPALQNLAQRPDLIPQVIAELHVMVGE
ncbi:hypothetical protein NFB56_16135 [Yersinia ruckeri]|uniref:hypothetical protein n=1 Tax=Yersinia ruckeri TaxID=29486 RepID=UPI002238DCE2|nr:hypothetical protein [Yersinia ruckeri]MCW6550368.1 hypothetical protein [Yersinia ruckeri]